MTYAALRDSFPHFIFKKLDEGTFSGLGRAGFRCKVGDADVGNGGTINSYGGGSSVCEWVSEARSPSVGAFSSVPLICMSERKAEMRGEEYSRLGP